MPPRFEEICELLQRGTENGTLKWTAFETATAFTTSLKNTTFVISAERFKYGEPFMWSLRILDRNGDEVDSLEADAEESGASVLSALWKDVNVRYDRTMAVRLRPIADDLRASVLGQ